MVTQTLVVCKVNGAHLVLVEEQLPDMSWLRGKLRAARAAGTAAVVTGPVATGIFGAAPVLDLDWVIGAGLMRLDARADAAAVCNERRAVFTLLECLARKTALPLLPCHTKLVNVYATIADFLGVAAQFQDRFDRLFSFPLPQVMYVFKDHAAHIGELIVWFPDDHGDTVMLFVLGQRVTVRMPVTWQTFDDGSTYCRFAWPPGVPDALTNNRIGLLAEYPNNGATRLLIRMVCSEHNAYGARQFTSFIGCAEEHPWICPLPGDDDDARDPSLKRKEMS